MSDPIKAIAEQMHDVAAFGYHDCGLLNIKMLAWADQLKAALSASGAGVDASKDSEDSKEPPTTKS
jgi:hypothetical protein